MYESTVYIISKYDTRLLYILQDSTFKKQLPTDKTLLFKGNRCKAIYICAGHWTCIYLHSPQAKM